MKKFGWAHLVCTAVVCLLIGAAVGAVVVAESKAGQIVDIIIERDKQLRELQAAHEQELRAAYEAVKKKAAGVLENVDAEEIGKVVQKETKATVEEAVSSLRSAMEKFKRSTARKRKRSRIRSDAVKTAKSVLCKRAG